MVRFTKNPPAFNISQLNSLRNNMLLFLTRTNILREESLSGQLIRKNLVKMSK